MGTDHVDGIRGRSGRYDRAKLVIWLFVVGTVVFLLANLVAGVPFLFDADPVVQYLLADAIFGGALVGGCLGYLAATGRGRDFLDVRTPGTRTAGFILLVTVVAISFNFAYSWFEVALGFSKESAGTAILEDVGSTRVFLGGVVTSILFIGPGEEVLSRGIIQKRLYSRFSGGAAVVIASLPFAIWHAPVLYLHFHDPWYVVITMPYMFVASLILGWAYLRVENLVVPALVHGLGDAFVYTFWYFTLASQVP